MFEREAGQLRGMLRYSVNGVCSETAECECNHKNFKASCGTSISSLANITYLT